MLTRNQGAKMMRVSCSPDLKEQSRRSYVPSYWIAMIYVGLDEKDEAFAWLEKAYQERSWWLLWIKIDPQVDSLCSDARFH